MSHHRQLSDSAPDHEQFSITIAATCGMWLVIDIEGRSNDEVSLHRSSWIFSSLVFYQVLFANCYSRFFCCARRFVRHSTKSCFATFFHFSRVSTPPSKFEIWFGLSVKSFLSNSNCTQVFSLSGVFRFHFFTMHCFADIIAHIFTRFSQWIISSRACMCAIGDEWASHNLLGSQRLQRDAKHFKLWRNSPKARFPKNWSPFWWNCDDSAWKPFNWVVRYW